MSELVNQQKRKQLLDFLDRGRGLVMIHLDPRREGVVVPPWLTGDPVLRLNIAYGFRLPALDVHKDGVYAVLSFSGRQFGCTLPWSAVFALTLPDEEHEGVVWPDDLPPELAPFFAEAGIGTGPLQVSLQAVSARAAEDAAEKAEVTPAGPALAVVEGDGEAAEGASDDGAGDEPEPKRPTLRLVKG